MLDILVAALRGATTAASAALARRRDIAALRAMDARELADLGIERAQIEDYVDGRVALDIPRWADERAARAARAFDAPARSPAARPRLRLVHSA